MTKIRSKKKLLLPARIQLTLGALFQQKKLPIANLAPYLLPCFNNGPVFGPPGTGSRDFRYRTQLSGDWGGLRTDLARRGLFSDLYSTSAYQDVASGGLKTGGAFIQNTQLSINVDTGHARLWPGRRIAHYLGSQEWKLFTAGYFYRGLYRASVHRAGLSRSLLCP